MPSRTIASTPFASLVIGPRLGADPPRPVRPWQDPHTLANAVGASIVCGAAAGGGATEVVGRPARRLKAANVASGPDPVAITTNCRPERVLYVIGFPLVRNGVGTRQISFPVALSNA